MTPKVEADMSVAEENCLILFFDNGDGMLLDRLLLRLRQLLRLALPRRRRESIQLLLPRLLDHIQEEYLRTPVQMLSLRLLGKVRVSKAQPPKPHRLPAPPLVSHLHFHHSPNSNKARFTGTCRGS